MPGKIPTSGRTVHHIMQLPCPSFPGSAGAIPGLYNNNADARFRSRRPRYSGARQRQKPPTWTGHKRGGKYICVKTDPLCWVAGCRQLAAISERDQAIGCSPSTLTKRNAEISIRAMTAGAADYVPKPTSTAFSTIDEHISQWLNDDVQLTQLPTTSWTLHEWLHFINNLPLDIKTERMAALDQQFDLTHSKNAEIAHAWYLLSVRAGYDVVLPEMSKYLIAIGRRKLIVPLYKELAQTEQGKAWALKVYQQARPGYHGLAQGTIDGVLKK